MISIPIFESFEVEREEYWPRPTMIHRVKWTAPDGIEHGIQETQAPMGWNSKDGHFPRKIRLKKLELLMKLYLERIK